MIKITLNAEQKFRAKTPYIKKASYNVVMYSPKMAENSVKKIRKMFEEGTQDEKRQLVRMLRMAGAIAMNNARNSRRYKRKEREKYHEVAIMYKSLRRDLENMLKE
jgi:Holliday junction resolvase RusA-like endonuclease